MEKQFQYTSDTGRTYLWDWSEIVDCFVFAHVEALAALEVGGVYHPTETSTWERLE